MATTYVGGKVVSSKHDAWMIHSPVGEQATERLDRARLVSLVPSDLPFHLLRWSAVTLSTFTPAIHLKEVVVQVMSEELACASQCEIVSPLKISNLAFVLC